MTSNKKKQLEQSEHVLKDRWQLVFETLANPITSAVPHSNAGPRQVVHSQLLEEELALVKSKITISFDITMNKQ